MPIVGWAERGDGTRDRARQLGAALPPDLGHRPRGRARVRASRCSTAERRGLVTFAFRHQVDDLIVEDGARRRRPRHGARADATRTRGVASSRDGVGEFELRARAVVVTSGGIGAQPRADRAELAGRPARARRRSTMITGVPAHVDGRMLEITEARRRATSSTATACGTTPRASTTGTRSGPTTRSGSSPARRRCGSTRPARGCRRRTSRASTRSARCARSSATGHDYSWFVLTQSIIEKEFALSGSEQNPDITGKDLKLLLGVAAGQGRARARCEAFKRARRGLRRARHRCASWWTA